MNDRLERCQPAKAAANSHSTLHTPADSNLRSMRYKPDEYTQDQSHTTTTRFLLARLCCPHSHSSSKLQAPGSKSSSPPPLLAQLPPLSPRTVPTINPRARTPTPTPTPTQDTTPHSTHPRNQPTPSNPPQLSRPSYRIPHTAPASTALNAAQCLLGPLLSSVQPVQELSRTPGGPADRPEGAAASSLTGAS